MSNNEQNAGINETAVPSRPSTLTIIILIGIVIGFFVVAFSADEIESRLTGQQPQAASTETK